MVLEPAMVPLTDTGSTVITVSTELAIEHIPLCTTARYFVVALRLVAARVVVVLAISEELVQLLVELCHLTIDPV